jgi:Exportin 1-like protein
MDSSSTTTPEEVTILRAIAISSSATWSGRPITTNDRQAAFAVLEDFSKYPGRIPLCLKWLQTEDKPANLDNNDDATLSPKLYACEVLAVFIKQQYTKLSEVERVQLRQAALTAAQIEAQKSRTDSSILSNKLASLLAALVVRDFPQRWTTMVDDVFGRLWTTPTTNATMEQQQQQQRPPMGNKICLEILKLVAEDCTDSDFNTKVSLGIHYGRKSILQSSWMIQVF